MPARLLALWQPLGRVAWGVGLLALILLQTLYHASIYERRTISPELDDVYTYSWQAERLASCLQSCAALDDLAPVLNAPSANIELQNQRARNASRLLAVYAPLQESFLLLVQRLSQAEWHTVYWAFIALGVALQALGVGLLLRALWGEWAAAFAMIAVAMTVYANQGLHFVVPSNMSLLLAMLLWAILLQRGRAAWRALLLGVLLLSLSHTIGRVYALMAVALYGLAERRWPTRREWGALILSVLIVLGYWAFARLSTAPPIDIPLTYVNPAFPTYGDLLGYQLAFALNALVDSVNALTVLPLWVDGPLLLGALLLLRQPWRGGLLLLLALALVGAMAFTSLPTYPGEGVSRVIILPQVALVAGGLGALLAWSAESLLRGLAQPQDRRALLLAGLALLVGLAAGHAWARGLLRGFYDRNDAASIQVQRQPYDLRREALTPLLAQQAATVLYVDEMAMLYGLTNGLHRFGALYPTILDAPPDPAQVDYILAVQRDDTDPLSLLPPHPAWAEFILSEPTLGDLRLYVRPERLQETSP